MNTVDLFKEKCRWCGKKAYWIMEDACCCKNKTCMESEIADCHTQIDLLLSDRQRVKDALGNMSYEDFAAFVQAYL